MTWHSTSVFSMTERFRNVLASLELGDWVEVTTFTGIWVASTNATGGSIGVWMK